MDLFLLWRPELRKRPDWRAGCYIAESSKEMRIIFLDFVTLFGLESLSPNTI